MLPTSQPDYRLSGRFPITHMSVTGHSHVAVTGFRVPQDSVLPSDTSVVCFV